MLIWGDEKRSVNQKRPKAGTCQECSKNSEEAGVARAERGKTVGREKTQVTVTVLIMMRDSLNLTANVSLSLFTLYLQGHPQQPAWNDGS